MCNVAAQALLDFDEKLYVDHKFAKLENLSKAMNKCAILFTGPSRTGKTTTLKRLCLYMQNSVVTYFVDAKLTSALDFAAKDAYIL